MEISGPAGCEGSGEGERKGAGRGNGFHRLHLYLCPLLIQDAALLLHGSLCAESRGAGGRLTSHRGVGKLLAVLLGEQISSPSGSVTALMTEALRQQSSSHTPLFLLDGILLYSFGVGQGLTVDASYWLVLRAWGYLIYMWEGFGCCFYMTDGHKPLYRGL